MVSRRRCSLDPLLSPVLAAWIAAIALAGLLVRSGLAADGRLAITVVDEKTRKPIPCRMHLLGPNKKPRKADPAPFWSDHFVFPGTLDLKLPLGHYTFEIERGPEYLNREGHFTIERFADDTKEIELRRFADLSAEGWWSGDLDVRRPPQDAQLLMAADDLHVAQVVTWWNDKNLFQNHGGGAPKAPVARFDQNRWCDLLAGGYSRSGTEVLCSRLAAPQLWPRGDPESLSQNPGRRPSEPSAPSSSRTGCEYPSLIEHLVKLREAHADLWVDLASPNGWDMAALIAHGQIDSIELINRRLCRKTVLADDAGGRPPDRQQFSGPFGFTRWEQDIYFKLLECGLRFPPTAGSGSGAGPNPVGYNRVYVHLDGEFDSSRWWKNLRAGQVVVTNGPLLRPTVEGHLPGYVFQVADGTEREFEIGLTVSSGDPISYLDMIQDGRVRHSVRFEDYAASGRLPKLVFERSGWFLLRVVTDVPETYRFAMTGPYYVEIGPTRRISRRAAQFFLEWVYERARQIAIDDPQQRREVMQYHRKARDFWQDVVSRANAE